MQNISDSHTSLRITSVFLSGNVYSLDYVPITVSHSLIPSPNWTPCMHHWILYSLNIRHVSGHMHVQCTYTLVLPGEQKRPQTHTHTHTHRVYSSLYYYLSIISLLWREESVPCWSLYGAPRAVSSSLSPAEPHCLSESRSLSVPSPAANTTTQPQYESVVYTCALVDIMVTHTQGKMGSSVELLLYSLNTPACNIIITKYSSNLYVYRHV